MVLTAASKVPVVFLFTLILLQTVLSLPFRHTKPETLNKVDQDIVIDKALRVDRAEDRESRDVDHKDSMKPGQEPEEVHAIGNEDDGEVVENNSNEHNKLHLKHEEEINTIKLPVEKLRPVDHMDAVRMEHDGHINKDFHKEMFLGNHEEFENERYEDAESKLKDIVHKVDNDQDGRLSVAELEGWVMSKMEEHFSEAQQENEEIFKHLDDDHNGKVHWKEYYKHFLEAKGYASEIAQKHVIDYDQIELDPDSKSEIIHYKFRWTDADNEPLDNELTQEEFMSFRHPEQSDKTLNNMVISIMSGIDTNGDGVVSEEEFTALPPGEVDGEEFQAMDKSWQKERQEEFRSAMDLDHDRKVTKEELKKYLDPRNPVQALMEAKNLISFMDDNHDNMLSLEEIMKHKDIFVSSKVMNLGANLHDEF